MEILQRSCLVNLVLICVLFATSYMAYLTLKFGTNDAVIMVVPIALMIGLLFYLWLERIDSHFETIDVH